MIGTLSPSSRNGVFSRARKRPIENVGGRPPLLEKKEKKDVLGTIYCGKDEYGNRTYKFKQYLLWTFREIVEQFNNEHNDKITYHVVQQTVKSTKYIIKIADIPEDDCRCERCENAELLLMGINWSLKEQNHESGTSCGS